MVFVRLELSSSSWLLETDTLVRSGDRFSETFVLKFSNTGGHSWNQSAGGDAPSSEYLYKIVDPINNTAIDIHEVCSTVLYLFIFFDASDFLIIYAVSRLQLLWFKPSVQPVWPGKS
jgi:hypothetical protein